MTGPWLAGLVSLGAIACATTRLALDPEMESCQADADCEVTGFAGCCACPGAPRAVNRAALAKKTDVCTVVECACAGSCRPCPDVADPRAFVAACRRGHCETARR